MFIVGILVPNGSVSEVQKVICMFVVSAGENSDNVSKVRNMHIKRQSKGKKRGFDWEFENETPFLQ